MSWAVCCRWITYYVAWHHCGTTDATHQTIGLIKNLWSPRNELMDDFSQETPGGICRGYYWGIPRGQPRWNPNKEFLKESSNGTSMESQKGNSDAISKRRNSFGERISGGIFEGNSWQRSLRKSSDGILGGIPRGYSYCNDKRISRGNHWRNPQRELLLKKSTEVILGRISRWNCWLNLQWKLLEES